MTVYVACVPSATSSKWQAAAAFPACRCFTPTQWFCRILRPEPLLEPGDIGLSICHRESARVQLGDAVHIRSLHLPHPKPIIGLLQIEVTTYVKPGKTLLLQSHCASLFME